jgi:hypothetical protein
MKPAAGVIKAAPTDVIIINDNIIKLAAAVLQFNELSLTLKSFANLLQRFWLRTDSSSFHFLYYPKCYTLGENNGRLAKSFTIS